MKDYEIKLETGKYAVNLSPIEMFAFGELVLDVRGPFFEHMATFMVAWAGLMSAFDEARYGNYMDHIAETFAGKIHARVDIAESILAARAGTLKRERSEISLCTMLAVTVTESLSGADRHKIKGPVYEVLRHVRNAAAHGNTWSFDHKEPRHPARSRNFEIDPRKGKTNPLQGKPCFNGSLMPADLLFLVRDVEILLMKP
jgi:hypothetical protein